jgi:predicted GIY-YIG superfamily endonuclease
MNALTDETRQMAPSLSRGMAVVYFLSLQSGFIYIGASLDLPQRLDDHSLGRACRTTQLDRPIAVLRIEVFTTFSAARKREAQLKRWSRPKKEALIRGDIKTLRSLSQSRDNAIS